MKYSHKTIEVFMRSLSERFSIPKDSITGIWLKTVENTPNNRYVSFMKTERVKLIEEHPEMSFGDISRVIGTKWKEENAHIVKRIFNRPFARFMKYHIPTVRKQNPHLRFGELSKKISTMWRALSPEDRQKWFDPPIPDTLPKEGVIEFFPRKRSPSPPFLNAADIVVPIDTWNGWNDFCRHRYHSLQNLDMKPMDIISMVRQSWEQHRDIKMENGLCNDNDTFQFRIRNESSSSFVSEIRELYAYLQWSVFHRRPELDDYFPPT
jgi:hypothetical protein